MQHRQMHDEFGPPGPAVHLDQPTMIGHDLGHQCQPKPAAAWLGGDEGIEKVRHQVFRDPGTIVLDAEFEWQGDPRLFPRHRQTHARAEGGGELDLGIAAEIGNGFGRYS